MGLITDEQSLVGATVRGHKLRIWDDGSGDLWVYRETMGVAGVVRAATWEDAFSCVVDEIMDDGDMDDDDNRPDADGNLPQGLYWRGSGVPSNEGLESPLASEDINGSVLYLLSDKTAERLEIEVEVTDDEDPLGMPDERCVACGKDYEGKPVTESCDCQDETPHG